MPATFVVDASVFLSAARAQEKSHFDSQRFLAHLQANAVPIIAPTLLLPEVGGAAGRASGTGPARHLVTAIAGLTHTILVPLDRALAQVAADIAGQCGLRGSDAVYAAVALRFGTCLVTLDREQRERVAGLIDAQYPAEACAGLGL
ncbi:MAG TPA: type II toxin-antitoxin system VapC family toxin [Anaerolineae bacterium]|nr:type II toxin-antitoxin system VapC family toxin [Anaerolineae bacterium]HOQ97323.1 type II toxin-antitoxin system VapC family toxin [Anaerolineae bacterium]HOQ97346.1 type II toxin-antitoxin system VapC family toxin [Anaerolineae bacterium]HPL27310.1 type II toxin-antitoxin system VapC family toxin [Anaerolineae bacterium]